MENICMMQKNDFLVHFLTFKRTTDVVSLNELLKIDCVL